MTVVATPLKELALSVRAYNNLRRNGIDTVEELLWHSEDDLMGFANFGRVSLREVRAALRAAGLPELAMSKPRRCPHCGEVIE